MKKAQNLAITLFQSFEKKWPGNEEWTWIGRAASALFAYDITLCEGEKRWQRIHEWNEKTLWYLVNYMPKSLINSNGVRKKLITAKKMSVISGIQTKESVQMRKSLNFWKYEYWNRWFQVKNRLILRWFLRSKLIFGVIGKQLIRNAKRERLKIGWENWDFITCDTHIQMMCHDIENLLHLLESETMDRQLDRSGWTEKTSIILFLNAVDFAFHSFPFAFRHCNPIRHPTEIKQHGKLVASFVWPLTRVDFHISIEIVISNRAKWMVGNY